MFNLFIGVRHIMSLVLKRKIENEKEKNSDILLFYEGMEKNHKKTEISSD